MLGVVLSCVRLFETPQTVACQAPLSMEFPSQEYWSGSSWPRDQTLVSCTAGRFFIVWATRVSTSPNTHRINFPHQYPRLQINKSKIKLSVTFLACSTPFYSLIQLSLFTSLFQSMVPTSCHPNSKPRPLESASLSSLLLSRFCCCLVIKLCRLFHDPMENPLSRLKASKSSEFCFLDHCSSGPFLSILITTCLRLLSTGRQNDLHASISSFLTTLLVHEDYIIFP